MKPWKRVLAFVLGLATLVVLFALWGVASLRTAKRQVGEGAEARAWEARHASAAPNDAAARLAAASASLGVDLSPEGGRPAPETARAIRTGASLLAQMRRAGSLRPLPEDLHAFLDAHASELDAITGVLLAELPDWGFDPADLSASRAPRELTNLRSLLVVAAVDATGDATPQRADRLLVAAWRVNESASRHPPSWPVAGELLSVLRLLHPPDAAAWIARLDAVDLRLPLADMMFCRAQAILAEQATPVDPETSRPPDRETIDRLLRAISDIPERVLAGRQARQWLHWEREVRGLAPCDRPVTLAVLDEGSPLYRVLERGDLNPWRDGHPLIGLDYSEAKLALTRRVLARAAGIEPPPSPAGACVDDLLVEERHADGSLTIRWTGPASPRWRAPRIEFTLAAGDVAATPLP